MGTIKRRLLSILILAGTLTGATAQTGGLPGLGGGNLSSIITRLFGDVKGFSCDALMKVKDDTGATPTELPMVFSVAGGDFRADLDLTKVKNDKMHAGMADQLKQLGMADVRMIVRPTQKKTILVYPGLKSYVDLPLSKEQIEASDKLPKIETVELAKESAEGHACVKNKLTVTDPAGKKQEVTVWNASDLKGFPVRMQFQDGDSNVTLSYSNVKMEQPAATAFQAPGGFTKYENMQALMQGAMQKMLGGTGKK